MATSYGRKGERKKMNILIFDNETTSLEKPFCYNSGYVVYNTDESKIVLKRDSVIEQVWHNFMLFTTAYYANKRELYVNRMRARQANLTKWGYYTQQLYRDIVEFEITDAYAYNSSFDEKVFAFNCDWFKTINPLDSVKVHDIRGYVHQVIGWTDEFQAFCDEHQYYTESGNYSTTAETVYRYLTNNTEFDEEHTALADSVIECEILAECVARGCEWNKDYKVYRSITKNQVKQFEVIDAEGEKHIFEYTSKRKFNNDNGLRFTIKQRG